MAFTSFWSNLCRNLLNRRGVEAELDSEVQAYFDTLVDRYTEQGLPLEEARRAVRKRCGGPDQVKENVREVLAGALVDATFQDGRESERWAFTQGAEGITQILKSRVNEGARKNFADVLLHLIGSSASFAHSPSGLFEGKPLLGV